MSISFAMEGANVARRSSAVVVTNNRYSQSVQRDRLDAAILEINVVRGGRLSALLRAGVDLVAGTWRRGENVEQFAVREVTISPRTSRVRASLDGENVVLQAPLVVRSRPRSLIVLKPRG